MKRFHYIKENILHSGYDLEKDEVDTKRIQLVNFIIVVGFPIFFFFMIANYELGFYIFAATNLVILALFVFGFFALRQSMNFMQYTINAVLLSMLLTHITALFQGGILNSGFLWFFLFPIFTMFFKEKKEAFRWIFVLFGIIILFFTFVMLSEKTLPYNPMYLLFIIAALGIEVLVLSFWHQIQSQFEANIAEKKSMLEDLTLDLEQRVMDEVAKSREKDELLSHQSKLAAMGEMLNNIAHQWKQPLGTINVIVQNMQIARSLDADDADIDASLVEIIKQTKLMNQAVYDFLHYSKPSLIEEAFDLNIAIQNTLDLIRPRLIAERIELKYELSNDNYEIFGKKNEFMHVLMNLFGNAREALNEANPDYPWIKVTSYRDGDEIVVQISDNAGGIDKEHIDKIFDVYFSTKEAKGGTGLGLYMCKKIVEQGIHGSLLASNTNMGALFELRFDCFNCKHSDSLAEIR